MTVSAWLSLLAICLLGAVSPGPSLALVIRNTVNRGRGAGLITAVSHGLGVGVYALATALGLAAVIATHETLHSAITLAGAGYLLWLGASAMRAGHPAAEAGAQPAPADVMPGRGVAAARDGLTMALLNPKIAVFFLALFSQFVTPGAGAPTVALLAGTATVVDAGWYALVATGLSASGGAAWLRRRRVWIERLTGAVLVFLALSTAATVLG
ncbi:lysine transporter LysE [Spiribacter sp. SSL99]|uniref:LysE family translocator n=1 Tax=Spiribacter sp. SSL99 TaxID=1866884 RepID=UPI00132FB47E|nr:LysE family translocator [Spiribacter sp. SSL99]KAF0286558.1 lysine transporter LysE [Spiribacter sp. SSL99]